MKNIYLILTLLITSTLFAQSSSSLVVPEWAKDAIWYQIFPERFANGDTTIDPPNVQPWGGKPKRQNYFGGDLQGIIDHLDYLQSLGINALYLNPIFHSNTNHKYHTTDYYKIDPGFGTEETFKKLVSECHKRGMHIIIDGVFNHTGRDFFAFEDIKKNEANSAYLHWFDVHGFPVGPPDKPNYTCWKGYGDLPKLMTDTPAVRNYIFDVTKYWMKTGMDGWRLDVPEEMSHDFWIQWRKLVKQENPNAMIVGEIWGDASDWLRGDQFDAVMNYRFRNAVMDFFVDEMTNVTEFDSVLKKIRSDYSQDGNLVLQNLIGSHDTERFLSLVSGDINTVRLAVLFQMTYVGAPMVYYGDEIGMEGGKDPDCRRTMVWEEQKWNRDLLGWYKKLIALRNDLSMLRRGSFSTAITDNQKKVYGYWRDDQSGKALVIMNAGSSEQSIDIPVDSGSQTWIDKLSGSVHSSTQPNVLKVSLQPYSGAVLIPEKK